MKVFEEVITRFFNKGDIFSPSDVLDGKPRDF